jgi:hypothetical protein
MFHNFVIGFATVRPQSGRDNAGRSGAVSGHNARGKAMARPESNVEYLNASADDFSAKVVELLKTEREIYDMLKQAKAEVLAQVRAEMSCEAGREVKGTTYTRWGQWQIVIGDKATPKAQPTQRKSLADYRREQEASGDRS